MKKTLIALAAVAATGAAFAQSTVTLSGVVGFGYQKSTGTQAVAAVPASTYSLGSAAVAAKGGVSGLTNTDATFRLGMVEDLGGGLKASAAVDYDTTGSTFASTPLRRNANIGLSGGFGSVAIHNTRSGELLTRGMVAPSYLPDGMFDNSGVITRAPVDVLAYTTPAFGAFSGYVQYAEAGTDGNGTHANEVVVLGVNYASGPLAAGFALKNTNGGVAVKNNYEAFATYDLGVAKVGFGLDTKNNGLAKTAWSMGVAAPLGAVTVGVNYAKRDTAKVWEAVAKYDLSKRTNLNASFGKQSVDINNQYRLAVVHNF